MNQEPIPQGPLIDRRVLFAGALGAGFLATACSSRLTETRGEATSPTNHETSLKATPDVDDPQLQLLEHYEAETGVAAGLMNFIGFPESNEDAVSLAEEMAGTLQAWHKAGVRPLVIMEPTFNGGQENMDLEAFNRGDYDEALHTYFAALKEAGVTDEQMGTWVPFPEPNDPGWANNVTSPVIFGQNATKTAKAIKGIFPGAKLSIMLDSQTARKADYSDSTYDPAAFAPYEADLSSRLAHVESGLFDSFGLQGFTWDNEDSAATYLSAQAAIAGARQLGVNRVWFNTGTYSIVNNPNGEGIIRANNRRRAQVLGQILMQAVAAQDSGLKIDFINIFGQDKFDKSKNGTGTADNQYRGRGALKTLGRFVSKARAHGIPVTIFDAARQ